MTYFLLGNLSWKISGWLEPLSTELYHSLRLVTKQREIWQFTSAKVDNGEDFQKYFTWQLMKEKMHSPTLLPSTTNRQIAMQAPGPVLFSIIDENGL